MKNIFVTFKELGRRFNKTAETVRTYLSRPEFAHCKMRRGGVMDFSESDAALLENMMTSRNWREWN